MKEIFFKVGNCRVYLNNNDRGYHRFLESAFAHQRIEAEPGNCDLCISLDWCKNPTIASVSGLSSLGGSTLAGEHSVITVMKIHRKHKIWFHAHIEGSRLRLDFRLKSKPAEDFFRYKLLRKPIEQFYYILTYHLVYYPTFWYSEKYQQRFPLHASAVNYRDKGILICGLEGVGKTMLALMFLREGAELCTDNLALLGRQYAYPCQELLRIHKSEDLKHWLGHVEPVHDSGLMKGFYRPKKNVIKEKIRPDILLFPEFGDKFAVQEISKEEARHRALILSYLPEELADYARYRLFLELLDKQQDSRAKMEGTIDEALKDCACYHVQMVRSDGLESNFRRLKGKLWEK